MWEIKSYNENGKEIVLKSGFATKNEADLFFRQHYKDKDDTFIAEKKVNNVEKIDISDKMGQWIWLWSPKKQEMFPYGILRKHSSMFVKIQTREEATALLEMADIRLSSIEKWLESGKGELRESGHFVTIKEYV